MHGELCSTVSPYSLVNPFESALRAAQPLPLKSR